MNFRGSRDSGPFLNILRAEVSTVPGNMQVKFEVGSFECIVLLQGSDICLQDIVMLERHYNRIAHEAGTAQQQQRW